MTTKRALSQRKEVALLAEGVDRNTLMSRSCPVPSVALLAEGVDRNTYTDYLKIVSLVALLAEGVDRNTVLAPFGERPAGRPPRGGRG